jgi:hypothetical protein
LKTVYARDIFALSGKKYVVIPTNIGWTNRGLNVMGAGVAKAASAHFPSLALDYGRYCRAMKSAAEACFHRPSTMILFPTKRLNEESPHISWRNKSDIELVKTSATQLANLAGIEPELHGKTIYLPMVGCGNGGLDASKVLPILLSALDDRFTLVLQP